MNKEPKANSPQLIAMLLHEATLGVEQWYTHEDQVMVHFRTPLNSPSSGQHVMTKTQALRQFALMTSNLEGWILASKTFESWHAWVESLTLEEGLPTGKLPTKQLDWAVDENGEPTPLDPPAMSNEQYILQNIDETECPYCQNKNLIYSPFGSDINGKVERVVVCGFCKKAWAEFWHLMGYYGKF